MSDIATQGDEGTRAFAVIVGTDVAFSIKMPLQAENAVAALSSNPTIIEIPENLKNQVVQGWFFDGTNFTPPERTYVLPPNDSEE
jgi:hypothetical protein